MRNKYKKILLTAAILAVAAFIAGTVFNRKINHSSVVALVGNETIDKKVYEKRKVQLDYFTKWLSDNQSTSSAIPTDLLDKLIEETLTIQFAKENNLLPSSREVAEKYKSAVKSVGLEKEYLEKIKTIQGIGKEDILERIKLELARERVEQLTKLPFNIWIIQEKEKASIIKY